MPVATNQGFASLVAKVGMDERFVFYLAQTLRPVLTRLAAGTTFIEVSRREVRRVKACIPSAPEERTLIGEILSQADAAVEASGQKLLRVLRIKSALMRDLFTKGIPGRHSRYQAAKIFRHSFVVPNAWDFEQLKGSLVCVEYGTNEPSNDDKLGFPVVGIPQVIARRFRLGDCSYAELPEPEANALKLERDDVLLVRTTEIRSTSGSQPSLVMWLMSSTIAFASYLIRVRLKKKGLR